MTQHHIPKDPNFQAPEYLNITMTAQKYKRKFLTVNYTIWVDIWYTYVTAEGN